MLDITDTKSLTEFNRNSREHVERLRETGKPELLTVNGEAAVVVQDAAAYQELERQAEYATTVKAVRAGMEAHDRGEGIDFLEALEGLAKKNGIKLPKKKNRS
jgi:prevent-host-death family protein